LIGRDFHPPHRAGRIAEELARRDDHDIASSTALQTDTRSPTAAAMLGTITALAPITAEQRVALELLRGWDGDVTAASPGALVFEAWSGHMARRRLEPHLGHELFARYHADREPWHTLVLPEILRDVGDDEMLAALGDTIAELRERLGADLAAWRWGAVHRLRLAHPLASIPGLEPLFTAVDEEVGGDETTVAQASFDARHGYDVTVTGSWRAVYDLADLDRSVGVLPAGMSGNPASPHWNDQAPLWLAGRAHPLPFTPAAIERATVAIQRLVPSSISD
jgi:penicillin amidase